MTKYLKTVNLRRLRRTYLVVQWLSACQCRGHRFEPWSGKIPHAVKQVSPRATTTQLEPARLEPVLRNKRSHQN